MALSKIEKELIRKFILEVIACCCGGSSTIGETTEDPPTTPPAPGDPFILANEDAGKIWIWNGTSWGLVTSPDARSNNIGISLDGNGLVVATGYKGRFIVESACNIIGWTLLEVSEIPIACTAVFTVNKGVYADYDTTPIFTAISGTEKPTLTNAVAAQDLTLTTWTIALAEGDILDYSIDSNDLGKAFLLVMHTTLV